MEQVVKGGRRGMNVSLYLVTHRGSLTEAEFLYRVKEACQAGVTLVQLREKDSTTREYIRLGKRVHEITKEFGIPLLIDDRVDVALAVGAEGVHLGETDMEISTARTILGPRFIIGATAKEVEAAKKVVEEGADYIGTGAIFPTTTKVITRPTSIATLKAVAQEVPVPVIAIGGIDVHNMEALKGSGISGVAMVSAIMQAEKVTEKVEALKEVWERISL